MDKWKIRSRCIIKRQLAHADLSILQAPFMFVNTNPHPDQYGIRIYCADCHTTLSHYFALPHIMHKFTKLAYTPKTRYIFMLHSFDITKTNMKKYKNDLFKDRGTNQHIFLLASIIAALNGSCDDFGRVLVQRHDGSRQFLFFLNKTILYLSCWLNKMVPSLIYF